MTTRSDAPRDRHGPARDLRGPGFRTDRGRAAAAAMVAVMWVVEALNSLDSQRLDAAGIRPRVISGLAGILLGPFLHASFGHLIGNTIPFVILGGAIALTEGMRLAVVTGLVGDRRGLRNLGDRAGREHDGRGERDRLRLRGIPDRPRRLQPPSGPAGDRRRRRTRLRPDAALQPDPPVGGLLAGPPLRRGRRDPRRPRAVGPDGPRGAWVKRFIDTLGPEAR